ncbi:major facilitator superfamily domain-containing protein [Aspergillus pseudoustus]|uniref:Major facilitator superfamily domain-containing protein n=1 Tax=Aspergillus pseudoustus TaxID=1810923 RepID=A0ABR4KYA0_9EURO
MRLKPTSAPVTTLRTFDFTGSILVIAGTVCSLYGLESGSGSHGWSSAQTLGLLLGGLALLTIFTFYEWRIARQPILPLRHLLTRATIPCLLTATFHSFTFIPYTYFNPLYFQSVLHISPIKSGVYLFALVLPLSAMTLASGLYVKRTGSYRLVIWIAGAVMVTGTGLFIDFDTNLRLEKIVLYQLVAGLGAGPLFQAPMIAYQSCLEPNMVAPGNAALAFLKNLGTSLSLVLGGVVVQGVGGGLLTEGYGETEDGSTRNAGDQQGEESSFMKGLKTMWVFYTVTCAVMWLASFGIQRRDLDGKEEQVGDLGESTTTEKRTDTEGK